MNITDRYLNARINMEKTPVPTHLLRGYLDTMRAVRRFGPGLHETVIMVDRNSSPEVLQLFADSAFAVDNVRLEVRN